MSGRNAAVPKEAAVLKEDRGPGHIVESAAESLTPPSRKKRGRLLILLSAPLLLLLGAAGYLTFADIIKLPFLPHHTAQQNAQLQQAQFIKVPELVANLDAGPDSDSYAKMDTELEVTDAASAAAVNTEMPAIIDLFQTYLRSMQPNDLRGSEGLYRLREALLARANIIVAPATVQNVLFIEMVVQ